MQFSRQRNWLAVIAGLMSPAFALAQAVTPATSFMAIANAVQTGINTVVTNNPLSGVGWTLFGFFVAANLVWVIMKGFFSGSGLNGVVGDLVPLGVTGVVAWAFLGGGGNALSSVLDDTMSVIGQAVTGSATKSIGQLIVDAGAITIESIINIWAQPVNSTPKSFSWDGLIEIISIIPVSMYTIVAAAASTFLILVAMFVYMATLVMSQINIEIAKLFAPLFVPFLLFRPASWMFDGWLRFFLSSALLKIVGLLLLQITSVILAQMLQLSQNQVTASLSGIDAVHFDITKMSVMFLMAGLCAMMMAKAPSIATGLLSGGGGATFGGWSDIASKAPGTKMLLGGMGAGAGRGGAAGAAGGNALSGVTSAMPNVLKPATHGLGAIVSRSDGVRMAQSDSRGASMAGDGTRNISRDMSQMPSATQAAYSRHLEGKNAGFQKQAQDSSFYGPPSPRYTVSKPTSSITPSKK